MPDVSSTGAQSPALATALAEALALDAPLADRLAAYATALRRLNRPFAEAVDRLVDRLEASDAGTAAPQVGEPLPPFLLPDDTGHLTSLDEIVATGPVAIVFHRGHWCPYCRITNDALSSLDVRARAAGGRIVAIMPDRQAYVAQLKAATSTSKENLSPR